MSIDGMSVLRPALLIHGGAGAAHPELHGAQRAGCGAALDAAWPVLMHGGRAVDAVCEAVAALENDAAFNAGVGSCLTRDGHVEMDAAIMDGNGLRAGAAAVVRTVRNPIRLARAIMNDGQHVFLAGPGADTFAHAHGVPTCAPETLVTAAQRQRWQQRHATPAATGTVGAVAVDLAGHVAAATSTGGTFGKLPGRVGDSPLLGAGTYADDALGAASATGDGEAIMRLMLARAALSALGAGTDPAQAAQAAVTELAQRVGGSGGVILIDRFGRLGHAFNTAHMTVAYMRAGLDAYVVQV